MWEMAAFNWSASTAPSMGFTVTSCLPYWVFSVENVPKTISGWLAKYELMV